MRKRGLVGFLFVVCCGLHASDKVATGPDGNARQNRMTFLVSDEACTATLRASPELAMLTAPAARVFAPGNGRRTVP